jgi:GGDEF domain-containing protein
VKPSPTSNGVAFLNQGAFLNQVEFSNNGALDSLTGAPAPKVFFDNLAREISKSKRKFQPISIVMVQVLLDFALAPEKVLGTSSKALTKKVQIETKKVQNEKYINLLGSAYEKELILVGRCLKSNMRGGDFYSRIADNGFWICLQGDAIDAQKAANRFALKISEANNLDKDHLMVENQRAKFVICEWDGSVNEAEWIQKIDLLYFSS